MGRCRGDCLLGGSCKFAGNLLLLVICVERACLRLYEGLAFLERLPVTAGGGACGAVFYAGVGGAAGAEGAAAAAGLSGAAR